MSDQKIVCHDLYKNKFVVSHKKLAWRPSVYGVLVERNKVLLSKQFSGYDFPGGGVNLTETLDEALKREFFEETGLKIKVLYPLLLRDIIFSSDLFLAK